MGQPEKKELRLKLKLKIDESGRILKGEFQGKELAVGGGKIKIKFEDEPQKYCKIQNGVFCCTPRVTGIPL